MTAYKHTHTGNLPHYTDSVGGHFAPLTIQTVAVLIFLFVGTKWYHLHTNQALICTSFALL